MKFFTYCWNCEKQVFMKDSEVVVRTSSNRMLKGFCEKCGKQVLKFDKKLKAGKKKSKNG